MGTVRESGHKMELPSWVGSAFPTIQKALDEEDRELEHFLVGYEICDQVRKYHETKDTAWKTISSLEALSSFGLPWRQPCNTLLVTQPSRDMGSDLPGHGNSRVYVWSVG